MPSVRLNWRLALALAVAAAPAIAGPAPSRRELPSRAPVSQAPLTPVLQQPIAPGVGQWAAGAAPRELRSLSETRRSPEPAPIVIPVSGAVALLEVEPAPLKTSAPKGLMPLLEIDEVHPATLQRPAAKKPVVLLDAVAAPQVLTPGQSR